MPHSRSPRSEFGDPPGLGDGGLVNLDGDGLVRELAAHLAERRQQIRLRDLGRMRVQVQHRQPTARGRDLQRLSAKEPAELRLHSQARTDLEELHRALRDPRVETATQRLVADHLPRGQRHDWLEEDRHGAEAQQLRQLLRPLEQLLGLGQLLHHQGAPRLEAVLDAQAELDLAEVDDVPVAHGLVLDALAVHERPVRAADVAQAEAVAVQVELGVFPGNRGVLQGQLQAGAATDPEGKRRELDRGQSLATVDEADQDPGSFRGHGINHATRDTFPIDGHRAGADPRDPPLQKRPSGWRRCGSRTSCEGAPAGTLTPPRRRVKRHARPCRGALRRATDPTGPGLPQTVPAPPALRRGPRRPARESRS